jgi:hypothetical protein
MSKLANCGGRILWTDRKRTVELIDPQSNSERVFQYRRTDDGGIEKRILPAIGLDEGYPWETLSANDVACMHAVRGTWHPILNSLGMCVLVLALAAGAARSQCTCAARWSTWHLVANIYKGAGWIFNYSLTLGLNCEQQSMAKPQGQCTYCVVVTLKIFTQNGWIPASFSEGGTSVWSSQQSATCASDDLYRFGATNWYLPDPAHNLYSVGFVLYDGACADPNKSVLFSLPQQRLLPASS